MNGAAITNDRILDKSFIIFSNKKKIISNSEVYFDFILGFKTSSDDVFCENSDKIQRSTEWKFFVLTRVSISVLEIDKLIRLKKSSKVTLRCFRNVLLGRSQTRVSNHA